MLVSLALSAVAAPVAAEPFDKAALIAQVDAAFAPATDADADAPPFACTTGIVKDLKAHWDEFTPAEKAAITHQVAPLKRDLLDPMVPPTDRPMLPEKDTCWGQQNENRVQGEHFSVEWDGTTISETTANNFLAALETGWTKEIDELGWHAPDGTAQHLILAQVTNQNYAGAYTTVDNCNGVYEPYIVAGKGSFQTGNWYQDMAAHEFNHASQFSYGQAFEFWFWEATATYVQDDVWPDHEWWSTYVTGYTDRPWMAMNAESQQDQDIFWHMYGMSIWLFYLDQYVDGPRIGQDAWEYAAEQPGYYTLGQQRLVEGLGYDWDEVYTGFMAENTVMDYEDHSYYPEVRVTSHVTQLPNEGDVDDAQSYGQDYVEIDPGLATADLPDLHLAATAETAGKMKIILVGVTGGAVVEVDAVELDDTGAGEVVMSDFGRFDDVWLVGSPTATLPGTFGFSWTLEARPAPEPLDTGDGNADGDGNGGGVDVVGGCGCDGSGGFGPGALAIGLALLAARRQRS
jgi:hypothetical protein